MSQLQYLQEDSGKYSQVSASADDLHYWLALLYAPGIGPATYQRILSICSTPRLLFESVSNTINLPELKFNPKTKAYLKNPDWNRVVKELEWAEKDDCHIISLKDPCYPALLAEITDPPPLLFVRGHSEILATPQLAIVGSRNPSAGGRSMARDFAQQLTQAAITVTSGLALGIDAASHEGALEAGSTVAVAGTGLDRVYPARHRELAYHIVEKGALISEFPLGTPPVAGNFPRRNRIISGLTLGTLVVEAALQSGSLITAKLAADQGREVFAIPGSIHNPLSRGCHELIRLGAKLVEKMSDILEEIIPLASWTIAATSNYRTHNYLKNENNIDSDNPVFENMGYEPISIDMLVDRSGLTAEAVSSMLLTLELQGRVTSTGGLYSRTDKSR